MRDITYCLSCKKNMRDVLFAIIKSPHLRQGLVL